MSKETTYQLTEAEANRINEAIHRGTCRMIAAQDLLDLPISNDSFENNLAGVLGGLPYTGYEPPKEIEMERAYKWMVKHYELISAIFTAVTELVNDTREALEMLPTVERRAS